MPTIKDVAELAGVAVGTVSHVLTGSVRVTEPLRLKVHAAIRELDYHPNHVARSLKTSRTQTLGIVVPDITISFYPCVIQGAEEAARAQRFSLIAVNSGDCAERQEELLSLLRSQRVEGVLLVPAAGPQPAAPISRMMEAGVPVVCLDRIPGRIAVDSVSVDDAAAARMAVEHLIAGGCRDIAIVTGPLTLKNERGRLEGYREAHAAAGLETRPDRVWSANLRQADVAAMVADRLSRDRTRPDAVFSTNGPTGLGVLRAFREAGLRTPEDIAFVTFDELTVDDLFRPSITTVVQPAFDIGQRACELLIGRIRAATPIHKPVTVRLPARLVIRESTSPRQPANVVTGCQPQAARAASKSRIAERHRMTQ